MLSVVHVITDEHKGSCKVCYSLMNCDVVLTCMMGSGKYGDGLVNIIQTFAFEKLCVGTGGIAMVWVGISWRHRTHLVVIDGDLTTRHYTDNVLETTPMPFLQYLDDVPIFQQDNAWSYSATITPMGPTQSLHT